MGDTPKPLPWAAPLHPALFRGDDEGAGQVVCVGETYRPIAEAERLSVFMGGSVEHEDGLAIVRQYFDIAPRDKALDARAKRLGRRLFSGEARCQLRVPPL